MSEIKRNKLQQVADQIEVRVLNILRETAVAGRPCPTNADIADLLKDVSVDQVAAAVSRLRKRQRIISTYTGSRRKIAAIDPKTGIMQWTEWTDLGVERKPHKAAKEHSKPQQSIRLRNKLKAVRGCLSCGKSFNSAHPGNRICSHCKNLHEWRDRVAL